MQINTIYIRPIWYLGCLCVFLFTLFIYILTSSLPLPFGTRFLRVSSDSMSPVIPQGSLILIQAKTSYAQGDIVSYLINEDGREKIITHRIVREGGNVFITQGDANEAIDKEYVRPYWIIGSVTMVIPYVGQLAAYMRGLIGSMLLLYLPAAAIIWYEIYTMMCVIREQSAHPRPRGRRP